ncbi:hypothetical protein IMSHALPRED_005712 [Imshaugia aleurites]|uniref:F-box domain-containing protein n=1 Tax=Imshaugia aleurites TaxID=172621 RepID=A0A8H3IC41_9LECA|nr:hypothetical protein IMSHALPRED_005712 [Imshaugia aleurites]
MACPLSAILNPVDGAAQANPMPATGDDDDDATISEASSRIIDQGMPGRKLPDEGMPGINTSTRHRRSSTETDLGVGKSAKQVIIPPVILSPDQDSPYNRRASLSPTLVTVPPTPSRRDPLHFFANDPSPPSHEINPGNFSVFNALLNYPELTLEFSKQLDIEDLVSLYAVSKEFHFLVNGRFTAMILGQSNGKASESSKTFIFRCYKSLCMRDPARRVNETKPDELRFVPSLRWLRMILFREAVVDDILQSLAAEGHRVPKRTRLTVKKIWFTIDISDNARRIGLIHNTSFWSNKDLFLATMFFLKIDMRLTHPTAGNGETGLRKLLFAQRSLSTLAKVLRREEMRTQVDLLRMLVRFNYEPRRHRQMDIMGVPSHEIGRLQYEGWGAKDTKFIQIDELVMMEAVKRRLNLQRYYVDMVIYGYINKKTFQDIRTPMPEQATEATEDSEDDSSSEENEEANERHIGSDTNWEERGAIENGEDVEMDDGP